MISNDNLGGTSEHHQPGRRGEFFVVDRRAFAVACEHGLNPAVAYLTITRGAGSRPKSCWSVDAIERHTGMSRPKANRAVQSLLKAELLTRSGAPTRPVYSIVAGHEVGLTAYERDVVNLLQGGPARLPSRLQPAALELWSRGYLHPASTGHYSIKDPARCSDKPQHVWLPNAS
jgi:hypothetical protein